MPYGTDGPSIAQDAAELLGLGWARKESAEPQPPTRDDAILILVAAVVLTLARVAFQRGFAAWWKVAMGEGTDDSSRKQLFSDSLKASESAWKGIVYSLTWLLSFFAVWGKYFWSNTLECWTGAEISPFLRWVYLTQLAYYVHATFAHFTIEVRRSDFVPMAIHHFVTLFLVAGSFHLGYTRVGGLVLILFDCGDVLLEFGKLSLYTKHDNIATCFLASLMFVWWYLRVWVFGWKVLYTASVESLIVNPDTPGYWACNISLAIIWCLNFYWGTLLLRTAYRTLTEDGQIEDVREDEIDGRKQKKKSTKRE